MLGSGSISSVFDVHSVSPTSTDWWLACRRPNSASNNCDHPHPQRSQTTSYLQSYPNETGNAPKGVSARSRSRGLSRAIRGNKTARSVSIEGKISQSLRRCVPSNEREAVLSNVQDLVQCPSRFSHQQLKNCSSRSGRAFFAEQKDQLTGCMAW